MRAPLRTAGGPLSVWIPLCSLLWLLSALLILWESLKTVPWRRVRDDDDDDSDKRLGREQPPVDYEDTRFGAELLAAPNPNHRKLFKPQAQFTDRQLAEAAGTHLSHLLEHNSSRLLGLDDLNFLLEPRPGRRLIDCPNSASDPRPRLNLSIVVNSAAGNFERRRRLRSSWLNEASIRSAICSPGRNRFLLGQVDFLFALARPSDGGQRRRVASEWRREGDLLVMSLEERYRNMSLKHLAIFKWLLSRRGLGGAELTSGRLLLKCDDDAQLDLAQWLERYVQTTQQVAARSPEVAESGLGGPGSSEGLDLEPVEGGGRTKVGEARSGRDESGAEDGPQLTSGPRALLCARFPANSPVRRRRSKWRLERSEWPFDTFPAYCSGLAYLTQLGLVRRLLLAAHLLEAAAGHFRSPLWVDDVYVTGVLLSSLEPGCVKVVGLNEHFCYSQGQWARRKAFGRPCMAAEVVAPFAGTGASDPGTGTGGPRAAAKRETQ